MAAQGKRAPGPRGPPWVGHLKEMRGDRVRFMLDLARDHGPVARFQVGKVVLHLLSGPAQIKHVLADNAKAYTKKTRGFAALKPLLGEGLLTSDGAFWLRQRRIAQPAFHRERIASFAALMGELATQHRDRWDALTARESPVVVDVLAEMMQLALRMVGCALLSKDVADEADRVGRALTVALGWANAQITQPFQIPRQIPTPANRRIQAAIGALDAVVNGIIAERRKGGDDPGDLLSLLMQARDQDTGEGMNDRQLRDEVMTLFLAGHETTANLMAWTWLLLARFPQAARTLRAELGFLQGRAPTFEELPRLTQTRRVLDEALRLYPPAWSFGRSPAQDDEIDGYRIPKGSVVLMSPFVTHRLPGLWDDPEGFDPDRFDPARFEKLPRFAYFPFGGGPRQCIGNSFALMEATVVLATLAQRFRPELMPGQAVALEPTITLRPLGGLPMRLARV